MVEGDTNKEISTRIRIEEDKFKDIKSTIQTIQQAYSKCGGLNSKPNVYTLLIYIGDITLENYDKAGGDLELKTKEITRIEPFTKRAVLFKGYIPHQAYAPLVPGLTRISIAFKFIDTSNELPFIIRYT